MSTAPVITGQVLPSSTPVPATSAKPKDFLQKLGDWFKNKFVPVASVVEKDVTIAAEAAEPFVDIAVPGIAALYHTTLQLAVQAEAVTAGVSGMGAAKLASVVSALEPLAVPYLKSIGVADPTRAQIEAYVNSVVAGLKIFTAAQPAQPVVDLPQLKAAVAAQAAADLHKPFGVPGETAN